MKMNEDFEKGSKLSPKVFFFSFFKEVAKFLFYSELLNLLGRRRRRRHQRRNSGDPQSRVSSFC